MRTNQLWIGIRFCKKEYFAGYVCFESLNEKRKIINCWFCLIKDKRNRKRLTLLIYLGTLCNATFKSAFVF